MSLSRALYEGDLYERTTTNHLEMRSPILLVEESLAPRRRQPHRDLGEGVGVVRSPLKA
jgi:hypothetical protein